MKITKTENEWREFLAQKGAEPHAFEITRQAHTERPYSGKYEGFWSKGQYHCVCCGSLLFNSETKFDAGCGWPSFYAPALDGAIAQKLDTSHGMRRLETVCAKCDAHLGHVFPDGPQPSGERYCMNSASLEFIEDSKA